MNTVNNSYSVMSSLDHMKKCLEVRMEQLAKEDICLAFSGGVDSSLLLKTAADAGGWQGSWEESMKALPWTSWSRRQ